MRRFDFQEPANANLARCWTGQNDNFDYLLSALTNQLGKKVVFIVLYYNNPFYAKT